mmetsp:Transcript_113333/g.158958  ORF Transcript_113333/g.158958 Transcript_113333/m.158958 type:complete len:189 (+) Transcript_113333:98-664(+)
MADAAKARFELVSILLNFLHINPSFVPSQKKLYDRVYAFKDYCAKIVKDRKAERNSSKTQEKDLLGILLSTQDFSNPADRYSDDDIINEFVTFFVAGMDTTGHLITMVLYCLHKNPEYLAPLLKDIDEIYLPKDSMDDMPTSDSIAKMDFTHCLLKEGLRWYTPAPGPLGRICMKTHELDGIKIEKGI